MGAIRNIEREILSLKKEIKDLKDRAIALPAIASTLKPLIINKEKGISSLQKIIDVESNLMDQMIENKRKMHIASKLNIWSF